MYHFDSINPEIRVQCKPPATLKLPEVVHELRNLVGSKLLQLITFLQLGLDFPFTSVSSNPFMFHCKGRGISNFRKLPLGVGTFHKKKEY